MSDVTQLLDAAAAGDPRAAAELLPLVYDELRKLAAARMAAEAPGQTLQATALVHEAYVRLVGGGQSPTWDGRGHFFAAAAEAMRRILIDAARRRKADRRGGGWHRHELMEAELAVDTSGDELFAVDEALFRLAVQEPTVARLVELRFFAGLTLEEAARSLGLSDRTAFRHWAFARAWLRRELDQFAGPTRPNNSPSDRLEKVWQVRPPGFRIVLRTLVRRPRGAGHDRQRVVRAVDLRVGHRKAVARGAGRASGGRLRR